MYVLEDDPYNVVAHAEGEREAGGERQQQRPGEGARGRRRLLPVAVAAQVPAHGALHLLCTHNYTFRTFLEHVTQCKHS